MAAAEPLQARLLRRLAAEASACESLDAVIDSLSRTRRGRVALVRAMHGIPAGGEGEALECAAAVVRCLLLPGATWDEPEAALEAAAPDVGALLYCASCVAVLSPPPSGEAADLPASPAGGAGGGAEANDVDGARARVAFDEVGRRAPRRVCQYVFRRNDIVWICRTRPTGAVRG